MCLIRKADAQGNLTQGCRTCYHQVAGFLQTPSHHIGMWRLANSQLEFPGEVRRASTCDRTEIPDVNGAVQDAVNGSSYAKHLPSFQAAPCGTVSARTTFDLGLQDVRCCGQRRLGRLLITPQLSPCSFKQFGHAVRNQVELLIGCRGRLWCGGLKSFHDHSLDGLSDAPDRRESAARGASWLVNQRYGRLMLHRPTKPFLVCNINILRLYELEFSVVQNTNGPDEGFRATGARGDPLGDARDRTLRRSGWSFFRHLRSMVLENLQIANRVRE